MGKRSDPLVPTRPSADELKKIKKLVALKNERGEKPDTWHKYTPGRVMIDAAIKEYEQEITNKELVALGKNIISGAYSLKSETT